MVEEELGFPHPCWRMCSGNFLGWPESYLPSVYLQCILASMIPHHGTQKWLTFYFWSFLIGLGFIFNSFCAVDKNHSLFSNLWIIVYGHCSCSPFVYWMTLVTWLLLPACSHCEGRCNYKFSGVYFFTCLRYIRNRISGLSSAEC